MFNNKTYIPTLSLQILKNATDMATIIIMHDITFTYQTSVNLCNSVYEFCKALTVGCSIQIDDQK
jgi:hypothetical protein